MVQLAHEHQKVFSNFTRPGHFHKGYCSRHGRRARVVHLPRLVLTLNTRPRHRDRGDRLWQRESLVAALIRQMPAVRTLHVRPLYVGSPPPSPSIATCLKGTRLSFVKFTNLRGNPVIHFSQLFSFARAARAAARVAASLNLKTSRGTTAAVSDVLPVAGRRQRACAPAQGSPSSRCTAPHATAGGRAGRPSPLCPSTAAAMRFKFKAVVRLALLAGVRMHARAPGSRPLRAPSWRMRP